MTKSSRQSSGICPVSIEQALLPIVRLVDLQKSASTDCLVLIDSGIRPKLAPNSKTPEDFSIKHIAPGFINLMGIESPGLTCSLAIAEYVEQMVRKEVLGIGIGKGRNISAVGNIDEDWA